MIIFVNVFFLISYKKIDIVNLLFLGVVVNINSILFFFCYEKNFFTKENYVVESISIIERSTIYWVFEILKFLLFDVSINVSNYIIRGDKVGIKSTKQKYKKNYMQSLPRLRCKINSNHVGAGKQSSTHFGNCWLQTKPFYFEIIAWLLRS